MILIRIFFTALWFLLPFAGLFFCHWFAKRRVSFYLAWPLWVVGIFGIVEHYVRAYFLFQELSAKGSHTSSTILLAYAPIVVLYSSFFYCLLGIGFGLCLRYLREKPAVPKRALHTGLALMVIFVAWSGYRYYSRQQDLIREQRVQAVSGKLTPEQVQEVLSRYRADENQKNELLALLRNPECPEAVIRELAAADNEAILSSIAVNPKAPVEILNSMAQSPKTTIRYYVISNPSLPMEALEKLTRDSEKIVATSAASYLKWRKEKEKP